jgi:hypothetical protein
MDQRIDASLAPSSGIAAKRPSAPRLGDKAREELRVAVAVLEAVVTEADRLDAATEAEEDEDARDWLDTAYIRSLARREKAEEAFVAACRRHGVDGVRIEDRVFAGLEAELVRSGEHLGYTIAMSLGKVVCLDD